MAEATSDEAKVAKSGPLTDLALTLPVFVGYHLGVIFLPVRNAADVVTRELHELSNYNLWAYLLLTLAIGAGYVTPLLLAGRGEHMKLDKFAWMGTEGIVYALAMRLLAGYAVAHVMAIVVDPGLIGLMNVAPALSSSVEASHDALGLSERLAGVVMSLGAGFYEELVFRVGLYGLGATLVLFLFNVTTAASRVMSRVGWAVLCACIFSGWHYIGEFGEAFDLMTFLFRGVCGLVFTLIYHFRGFAPAVWTHALYDIWVLAT
jgi:hypothetical protein